MITLTWGIHNDLYIFLEVFLHNHHVWYDHELHAWYMWDSFREEIIAYEGKV